MKSEIYQHSLFCPFCLKNLEIKLYKPLLAEKLNRQIICVYCGRSIFCLDIDLPRYQAAFRQRVENEKKNGN